MSDTNDAIDAAPRRARTRELALEALVSIVAAIVLPVLCLAIKVDPLDRLGQVSGLASMELRYTMLTVPLVVALIVAARWRSGVAFETTSRLACAAVAGLATGLVAGGIVVALRGTPFALNGWHGDAKDYALAAEAIRRGHGMTSVYPPLSIYVTAWYSDLIGVHAIYGLKHLQIAGTAMLGPAAYLTWRLLLPPRWALAIGLTAALPLIESAPYKPYGVFVLLVFIPLVVRLLQVLRYAERRSPLELARCGVAFGIALGLMCILYTSWFKWSAPGIVVAGLVVFPWRRAFAKATLLAAVVTSCFLLIAGAYLYRVATDIGGLDDTFIYFDAKIEPAFIAMFGGDAPPTYVWPPRGELGGVGVFTLLLAVGFGASIALARGRTIVITLSSTIVGAWLLRFWYAHLMFKTKLVQLYPRTTAELLYCFLISCGLALYFAVQRVKKDSVLRSPSATIGAFAGMLLVLGSAGSAISDRYMPAQDVPMSFGVLAWNAHHSSLGP